MFYNYVFQVFLVNLDETNNSVLVNNKPLKKAAKLKNLDLFTIIDRSFRLELPESKSKSPVKTPAKSAAMSPRKSQTPSKKTPSKILTPKVTINIRQKNVLFPGTRPCVPNFCQVELSPSF